MIMSNQEAGIDSVASELLWIIVELIFSALEFLA
jgi:hypothetical protein